jgi:uncharacterized delta-60 repeat protein
MRFFRPTLALLFAFGATGTRLTAASGQLDPSFPADSGSGPGFPNAMVYAVAVGANDVIYLGGSFQGVGAQPASLFIRLLADGRPDPSFQSTSLAGSAGPVTSIAVLPDGRLLVAGQLNQVGDQPIQAVTRLLENGAPDPTFRANGTLPFFPTKVAADSQGRVYLGAFEGGFSGVIRLLPDGTRDPDFTGAYGAGVYGIIPLAGGSTVVAGTGGIVRLLGSGDTDPGFNGGLESGSYALDRLTDGRLFVGGAFSMVGGFPRANLARLNSTGALDLGFAPVAQLNGQVEALLALPGGGVLAAGEFTLAGDQPRAWLAAYGPTGTLDPVYAAGTGPNQRIRALARQSTGAVIAVGAFTQWADISRPYLARLTPEGAVTPGFVRFSQSSFTGVEGSAGLEIVLERFAGSDGNPSVLLEDIPVAITNPNFIPATNGVHYTFTPRRIEFAPGQTTVRVLIPIPTDSAILRSRSFGLQLRDPAGGLVLAPEANVTTATVLDDDFGTTFSSAELTVSELAGNQAFLVFRQGTAGNPFSAAVNTVSESAVAGRDFTALATRVEFQQGDEVLSVLVPILDNEVADGPRQFRLRLSDPLGGAALGENAELLVTIRDNERPGGLDPSYAQPPRAFNFSSFQPAADGSALVISNVFFNSGRPVRIRPDGSLDPDFKPATTSVQGAAAAYPDGRFLVVSSAQVVGGNLLVRMQPDGQRDSTFATNVAVSATSTILFPQPDLSTYVSASGINQGTVRRTDLVRLLPNGQIDPGFTVDVAGGVVRALAVDPQGRVLIAGTFTSVGGVTRRDVARLQSDGTLDRTWREGIQTEDGGDIRTLAMAPDGSVYVGGTFPKFGATGRGFLIRLTSSGALDETFGAGIAAPSARTGAVSVDQLLVQPDGRLLVRGRFDSYGGEALPASLLRLLPDGSRDLAFDTGNIGIGNGIAAGTVVGMGLVTGNRMVIAGGWATIDGLSWRSWARLYLDAPRVGPASPRFQSVEVLPDGRIRFRLQEAVVGPYQLEESTDLRNWSLVRILELGPSLLEFTEPLPAGGDFRLYRLRINP